MPEPLSKQLPHSGPDPDDKSKPIDLPKNPTLHLVTPADLRAAQRQTIRDLLRISSRLSGLRDMPSVYIRYFLRSQARFVAMMNYAELQTMADAHGFICANPVCPQCGGTGLMYPIVEMHDDGRNVRDLDTEVQCDRCSGTGGWGG